MSLGKDESKIKLYGDNICYLKENVSGSPEWVDVGNLIADVNINDVTGEVSVTLNDGSEIDINDTRRVDFTLPLAQTGKDEIDFVSDGSRDKTYQFAYGNGKVGGKTQVFYASAIKVKNEVGIKTSDKPKKLMLKCNVRPQSAVVSIANSSLPTALQKPASSETFTGQNKFYAVIEF